MLKTYLNKVIAGNDLRAEEMEEILTILTGNDVSCVQAGALLAALRMKGETADELAGAANVLRRNAVFIDCGTRKVIDIVGTGGDGGVTFNISTASALVAAGAGAAVAKHGNRAASGTCGAADVLAELGFNLNTEPEAMERCILEHGIGFLFAQKMHPILGKVAALRKELGIRTIFNLLGPLSNPAGATGMVVGVFDAKLTTIFASALQKLGVRHALVVHGNDGLDEISCCDRTRVTELKNGEIKTSELYPEILLGHSCEPSEIVGGDIAYNARVLHSVLDGSNREGARSAVLLNAGAAIYVAGLAESIKEGIRLAEKSIDSGDAMKKLELLIEASKS